jgi:hypothetical protein
VTLPNGVVRYNHATTSVGYASSSEPIVRFGLGPYDTAAEIEVQWPGGISQRMGSVKADQVITIEQISKR